MPSWTMKDIPPQTGRIAVVTGATSGIGYETAKALAGAGAKVIIASRNESKGAEVLTKIRAATPGADVAFEPLDLASLDSVAGAATRLAASVPRIDILINNAGVMAIPDRHETEDGFEMQMGANYIGHFALNMRYCRKSLPLRTHVWLPSAAWRIAMARSISTICNGKKATAPGAPIASQSWRR